MRLDSRLLYLPLAFAVVLVFGVALALVLSAVNVYLRDVQYLVEISTMVLFWLSPIVYSWQQVAGALGRHALIQEIYLANPVTLAVLAFQRVFWSAGAAEPQPSHLGARLVISLVICTALLWLAQRVFTRLQGNFAQEL
jgi:ABC-2 type transport system permease protein